PITCRFDNQYQGEGAGNFNHVRQPEEVSAYPLLTYNAHRPRDRFLISNGREHITFERSQTLATSETPGSFTLSAGNYDFPFEIHLGSAAAETVTGPDHEYHTYKVQAIIERRFSNEFIISRPLRVYKVFELEVDRSWPSSTESIENQWNGNIHCNISIPHRNIPFGSTFPVEISLASSSRDIELVAVTTQVLERHNLKIVATAAESVRHNVHFLTSRKSHIVFSERHDFTVDNYKMSAPERLDGEWRIARPVRLPQTLDACSQTIRSEAVTIDHLLTTTIEFRNSSGCISTITKSFTFNIFMSPIVVREDATVHGRNIQHFLRNKNPPPAYGDHVNDSTILESSELSVNNDCGPPVATRVNIGRLPHEQAYGWEVLENVPSYEAVVCMMVRGT
ncbi:hypothetical protein N7510_009442, partial [Penicillium lagena]|uniref:uncharacterized protein n=1 Tax=Penicillium lagena TaxID=94218 RepID=UPI002541D15D